jgi:hypothetical protein
MSEHETDPKKIAASLIEGHNLTRKDMKLGEMKPVEDLIDKYVSQLSQVEIVQLISLADDEVANINDFLNHVPYARKIEPASGWNSLLQWAASFIVFRTLEGIFSDQLASLRC